MAFLATLALTPIYLKIAKRLGLGKKIRDNAMGGGKASMFKELHAKKSGTPTLGGVVMWGSVLLVVLFSRILSLAGVIPQSLLNRGEVYLPLFTLVAVGLLGAVDDLYNVKQIGGNKGIKAKPKFLLLTLFAILGGIWFYYKLGFTSIHIPSLGDFEIGMCYIPLFILVIVST